MNYKELLKLTEGKKFPLDAENENGENVIIEKGHNGDLAFFRVSTFQLNDWIRINCYYEDGNIDETYKR